MSLQKTICGRCGIEIIHEEPPKIRATEQAYIRCACGSKVYLRTEDMMYATPCPKCGRDIKHGKPAITQGAKSVHTVCGYCGEKVYFFGGK